MADKWCSHQVEEFGGQVEDWEGPDAFIADSECPEECRQVSSAMIQVSTASKVIFLSSVELISVPLNNFHSGVFGRELRRINAMTLTSIVNFMSARRASEVQSEAMYSKMVLVLPSQVAWKSYWKM